ncbi:hypothetical protein Vretimale_4987 [Volvox reticuliferus]|uniref:Protein LHCP TRANSLOCATION DEFECT n=1 Tax=Volvox reticuliferus TaxID=1737510 RepID=A0A8J4G4M6_9CHLO|nr:hypothetical protein Vretimale_4987 [Volvox reticuliferus]
MRSVVLASCAAPTIISRASTRPSRHCSSVAAEDAGIVGSQGRDDYTYDDVEQYFNYMGFLATEGTYDRMEAMLKSGLHCIDIILLLACSENDTPKVQEILKAGADPTVRGIDGKAPLELATKPELVKLLKESLATKKGVAV